MAATNIINSNVCPEHFWYTGSISQLMGKDADSVVTAYPAICLEW